MKTKNLLKIKSHRPWKIPNKEWRFYQEWNNAVFLHWEVDYELLKTLVPKKLEIDLFKGKAWVSIVAFTMEKIRVKNLPQFPPISNFDEINIRTYVKYKERYGVYFLNIEAGNLVSAKVSKFISNLPYKYSKMSRDNFSFYSSNKQKDEFKINYQIKENQYKKEEIDFWLTERYALFQEYKSTINEFEIHHIEWPIKEVEIKELNLNYPKFKDLINKNPDIQHYSKGVQVLAWNKKTHK